MKIAGPLLFLLAAAGMALAQDPEPERLKKEVERLKADHEMLLRQLEVALAQIKELRDKPPAELKRSESERPRDSAAQAVAELNRPLSQEDGKLKPGKLYAETPVLKTPNQSKVTAVANEIGLVVISIGSEHGVKEGDEYAITRGGEFVAKIKIDRTDAKWSAGKIILRSSDPRVSDDATRPLRIGSAVVVDPVRALTMAPPVLAAPAPAAPRGSVDELRSLRKELDDVRSQVRMLSDRVIPSWQEEGLATEELSEAMRSQLRIVQGVMIRQVREGSPASRFGFKPFDVVPDLGEAQLLRTLKEGGKVTICRQGKLETLQRDRSQ